MASLLPVGAIVGVILVIAGGVLLAAASAPFGRSQSRNATAGLVLAATGLVSLQMSALLLSLAVPSPPASSSELPSWVQSVEASIGFNLLLNLAFSAVAAFGLVCVTYSLQDRLGRVSLWFAFGLAVAIATASYVLLTQGVDMLLNEALAGHGLDSALLTTIGSETRELEYLQIVPQAIFACCFFLADTRIRRGSVPAKTTLVPPD